MEKRMVVVGMLLGCLAAGVRGSGVVLADGFAGAPAGVLAAGYLQGGWSAQVQTGVAEGRVAVVEEAGNRFIRVEYPAGVIGSSGSGAQWKAQFAGVEEAVLEYRVRFEPGFEWTEGGKLPGLAGGSAPVGGFPDPAGFTARYMWTYGGKLYLYLYHSEQGGQYGQGIGLDSVTAVAGQWHRLRQRVKLNTPGVADGELQVWFDGRLVLDRRAMRLRLAGHSWKIDSLYFSTFHGGGTDSYRPSRTNKADFDDFAVTVQEAPDEAALPPDPGTAVLHDVVSAAGIGTTAGGALPLQTIDAVATGPGAVNPAQMQGLAGLHINCNWQDGSGARFAIPNDLPGTRNYLAFSGLNAEGVQAAVRFVYAKNGATTSKYVGGYNSTGADIVVTAGNSIYLGQVLAPAGATYTVTFGRYTRLARNEGVLGFAEADAAGRVYAARAAGFILSGIAAGRTMTAKFYGCDGQLLAELAGLSAGETGAGQAAGAEIFFGHDAGSDRRGWIHRVEVYGSAGGNFGFDDFCFTPVAGIVPEMPAVIARPAGVWWGSYRYNEQLVDGGASQWTTVQQDMDGYLLHGAYWNYNNISPLPGVVGPKLAAILNTHAKPVILEHLLAGQYPNIDSAFGYAFAGTVNDAAGFGSAVSNIKRLMGYGFPRPDISSDYIMDAWKEAVRWHPEWTRKEFFTAVSGNWETYDGTLFNASAGSPDRQRYGWFRQWVERLADAFPGIRVTATNSPVYFPWEQDGVIRRELGGANNNFYTWLKLERRGDSVKALYSGDGYGWAELGSATVPLGSSPRAGLLAASGTAALAEGRVDSVTVLPFYTADIGRPGRGGALTASGGLFTLQGNGDHELHPGSNTTDAHFYAYRQWSGDGVFTARLYTLTGSNAGRTNPAQETPTAGITLRATTGATARQVSLHANLANQLEFLARTSTAGGLAHVAGSGSPLANLGVASAARYLRLSRTGNTVTAEHSPDGSAWTLIGSVSVDLGTTFLVGLVADSQVGFERATAGFTNVSFLSDPTSSFSGVSIGAAGSATSSLSSGTYTLRSAGAGAGGSGDSMRFHSTELAGDGTLIARLQYFADGTNPDAVLAGGAQLGVALRADTSAGAPALAAVFTPRGGLKAIARTAAAAEATTVGTYGEGECGVEPLGTARRPLLHYFSGNDYLGTLHEAFQGPYSSNYAGFTTDSPYAGYQKWGGSEDNPDAIAHRRKIILYEKWIQERGREHQFIANSAGGTDFDGFNTSTQSGRDGWDLLYKQQSLRSIQLHQLEGGRPDKVIFESWYSGPFALVPETKEGSFTNLVRDGLRYIKGVGQVLDLSIAPAGSASFGGAGFQQQVPSGEQRVSSPAGAQGSVSQWTVRLTNSGAVAALPVLHAFHTGTAGWNISYTLGGADVTIPVTSGEGLPVTDSSVRGQELVAPGASVDLTVTLVAPAQPLYGSILVRAFWNPQDPALTHRDAVRIDLYQRDPYAEWTSLVDWQAGDPGEAGDPDNDGLANLLEYALGGDPLAYEAGRVPAAGLAAGFLTISFDRVEDPALTYSVMGSGNLAQWDSVWTSTGPANIPGRVTVQDTHSLPGVGARFLRLDISRN